MTQKYEFKNITKYKADLSKLEPGKCFLVKDYNGKEEYKLSGHIKWLHNEGRLDTSEILLPCSMEVDKLTDEILGLSNPYPLTDVLKRLINAAEYLLHKKSYDGGDYEEIEGCVIIAKETIQLIDKQIQLNLK